MRHLKKKIRELLLQAEYDQNIRQTLKMPGRQVINPLFSFFYSQNELLKWRAVTAMGMVVDNLAKQNLESARVVMRRLMWNLNDESGGIGWGSAEAMGEIMAQNETIAKEFHNILLSYIVKDQNYLEHEMLQRGVLWGVGRLSHARPGLVKSTAAHLNPFMSSVDAHKRGFAAWAAGPLKANINKELLKRLLDDHSPIELYIDGRIKEFKINRLAEAALN